FRYCGDSTVVAYIQRRETAERLVGRAVEEPFAPRFEAEPVIEVPGGGPVQDSQIEPSAAALDRDRSEPRHEPPPDAEPARPFTDKDVLEVKTRPAAPSREIGKE